MNSEETKNEQPQDSETVAAENTAPDAEAENVTVETEAAADEKEKSQNAESLPLALKQKTRDEEKRLAAIYMIFAAAIVFCVYIAQLLHLLEEPLFSRVYYGNLKKLFFYVSNIVVWVPMLVGIHLLLKKYTGYKAFHLTRKEIPLKRIFLLYACVIVPIFIVSAALGFNLKIVYELGSRITGVQAWSNASAYLHGGVKLLFFVIFISIVQEAGELLYKG
ncbi:MAG: hypothetical protein K2M95_01170, partial [Clostridiales bacterium]|nr:hypothetical protein [Clostridiales bacterium]